MARGGFYLRTMENLTAPRYGGGSLPPVCQFIEMYDRGAKPFPRQKTLLKIAFLELEELTDYDRFVIDEWMESTVKGGDVAVPLDLYERMEWCLNNGYHHFHEIIFSGGRRGGKGFMGGKIAEYKTAQMIALGNPQRFYGIDDAKDLYLDVLATQYSQAQGMLYNDIKDAILMNDWLAPYLYHTSNNQQILRTPADMARANVLANRGSRSMMATVATIHIQPSAAVSSAIRGRSSYMQCFDEFAHGLDTGSKQSSGEIYDAATPSLQQFDRDGLIYIPSSPWSKSGKFYDLYQAAFEQDHQGNPVNPQMLAVRFASWEMYRDWSYDTRLKKAIILPPDLSQEMQTRERLDPEKFAVEFRAQFAETENAYLQPQVVDSLFEPFPSEKDNRNEVHSRGLLTTRYRVHADAGRSQDNFCCCIGHKEMIDGVHHAFIDYMKIWQHTDFEEDLKGVRKIDYTVPMAWFKKMMRLFFVDKFTMDQWNSAMFLDELRACSIRGEFLNKVTTVEEYTHTSTENMKRWELFKTACYQGLVHIPWVEDEIAGRGTICLAEQELKALMVINGNKVEVQRAGWGHGDMADCISTVVADLLGDQLNHMDIGDVGNLVGAAQGGYNIDRPNRRRAQSAADLAMQESVARGSEYMASMGYGYR